YTVVWYENSAAKRKVVETEDFYLVPLRGISFIDYEGDVYNMEVEEEHNYLAGFFAISNCQNWLTSQALRDDSAGTAPRAMSAEWSGTSLRPSGWFTSAASGRRS